MNQGAVSLSALLVERGAQKRLSDETGIDQGYLSRIARGERVPGLDVRRKLKAFGIELDAWDEPASEPGSSPVATDKANGSAA